jgi:hypothetical protein
MKKETRKKISDVLNILIAVVLVGSIILPILLTLFIL